MTYLFGDSTTSTLRSNFLEFLRDATDFGVFALKADHAIEQGKERIRALTEESEAELAQLATFIATVTKTIDEAEKGPNDSPASQCATRLEAMVTSAHRATMQEVQQRLAAAVAAVDAEEAASRQAVLNALGLFLSPRDAEEALRVVHIAQRENGGYDATLKASPMLGIGWAFDLAIPEGNAWRAPLRVEALSPHLEIQAPQVTGFISKEVKLRPLKIDRHVVTELHDDGTTVKVKLQAEAPATGGFDLKADLGAKKLKLARTGPAEDPTVGSFDIHADDVAPLLKLVVKLRAAAETLKGGTLSTATFDDNEFTELPKFGEVVERLVTYMAPIIREISDRSLMPTELVIRRALGNDRREEIFVSKSTIRDKYASLPAELAAVFRPLGLESSESAKRNASEAPAPPVVRAELAPSQPPPPMPGMSGAPLRITTARPPASSTGAVPPPATLPATPIKNPTEILEIDNDALEVRASEAPPGQGA